MDRIKALASEFDIPLVCLFSNTYLVSKDQTWLGTDCGSNRELMIAHKLTGNKITIPFRELDRETQSYFWTQPLYWSSDNQYFYFTTHCCQEYGNGKENGSLYQVNIKKESWHVLVHGADDPYYFFSDSGDRLVYVSHYTFEYANEIGMIEISSGKSKRLVLSEYYYIPIPADYAWSKNSDKFAIVIEKAIRDEMRSENVLLTIDFKEMELELVEHFNPNNLLEE